MAFENRPLRLTPNSEVQKLTAAATARPAGGENLKRNNDLNYAVAARARNSSLNSATRSARAATRRSRSLKSSNLAFLDARILAEFSAPLDLLGGGAAAAWEHGESRRVYPLNT